MTSVQHEWAAAIPIQQQSVLLLAARGPDGMYKHHPVKAVVRAYRACVLHAASLARPLRIEDGGDTFMDVRTLYSLSAWGDAVRAYFDHVDELPLHYHLHLLHGAEILGYKHPDDHLRLCWQGFYLQAVDDMHLNPETEAQLDERLNDFGRVDAQRV